MIWAVLAVMAPPAYASIVLLGTAVFQIRRDLRETEDRISARIQRFEDRVDDRFNRVDERFNRVDDRFNRIEERLAGLEVGFIEHRQLPHH